MIKLIVTTILDIIFPQYCVNCSKKNTLLCPSCFNKLEFVNFEFDHLQDLTNIDTLETICQYNQVSKKLVTNLKYKSIISIAKIIAHIIYRSSNLPPTDYYIPIPISKQKNKKRGFNQAEEIAKELSKLTNTKYSNLLNKTKPTKAQASMKTKKARTTNLKNSFSINHQLLKHVDINSSFTLVDDVITTGSTIKECSNILKKHHLKHINAIVFTQR